MLFNRHQYKLNTPFFFKTLTCHRQWSQDVITSYESLLEILLETAFMELFIFYLKNWGLFEKLGLLRQNEVSSTVRLEPISNYSDSEEWQWPGTQA